MSYHTIIIVGNLGRDPEMRYTPNGNAVTTINVASNRTFNDASGQRQKVTTWFRVSVWGKQAESVNNFLKKGSQVLVEGELQPDKETGNPRTFTRNDGSTGASYEVRAQTVRFLSSRSTTDDNFQSDMGESGDEEIPF